MGTVDSLSDAVTYQYDAVGNLLSIARNHSSQVSIIDFTPKTGSVGSTVTISGTGFSTTASQNSVLFNGTASTVTSATPTQLTTTVPSLATSGTLTATAPSGTATSTKSFTVSSAGAGAPTVTSFTPSTGTPGTALTITGTNFDTNTANDNLKLNLTSALPSSGTATSLASTVPTTAASGRISISTKNGKGTSTQDFFVPFGTHAAADISFMGRMSVNTAQAISIGTASKIGLMLFDGTAGQKISTVASNSSFGACTLLLIDPFGRQLASTTCTGASNFMDAQLLAYSGTYTIGIDPASTTGNLGVYGFSDTTGTLTSGSLTTVNLTTPGQNALYSFAGRAAQQAAVNVTNWTASGCPSGTISILSPDGSTLASANLCNGSGSISPTTMSTTGTYAFVFDAIGPNTGTATLTLTVTGP